MCVCMCVFHVRVCVCACVCACTTTSFIATEDLFATLPECSSSQIIAVGVRPGVTNKEALYVDGRLGSL